MTVGPIAAVAGDAWLPTLASVLLVNALPLLVAVALPRDEARLRRLAADLVSLAIGALLGSAMLHLMPEAFATMAPRRASALAIGGFVAFLVLEVTLMRRRPRWLRTESALSALTVAGDAVHNFVDGMVIAASFQVDTVTGMATTTAVVLHEVPQEIGDYGVLLFSGLNRRRALMANLLSAITAVLGAVVVLILGTRVAGVGIPLIPVAAGGFLYIAAADLVPALREFAERTWRHLLLVLLGIGLTALPLGLPFH